MGDTELTYYTVMSSDTDSYNIVHHPMYFVWFEHAALHYIKMHPDILPGKKAEELRLDFQNMKIKFKHPGMLHNQIEMKTRLVKHIVKEEKDILTLSFSCINKETHDILNEGTVEALVHERGNLDGR